MNKKLTSIFLFLFIFYASVSARDRAAVFFLESCDGMTPEIAAKIFESDNFSFAAGLDLSKGISPLEQELIAAGRLEPVIKAEAVPYLPLISSDIEINKDLEFDGTDILKNFLGTFETNYDNIFKIKKFGLYFDDFFAADDTFKYFKKYGVIWCASKFPRNKPKGAFIYDETAVFSLYDDFPSTPKSIEKWFLGRQEKIIPVYLPESRIKNAEFMKYIIGLFKNSKYTDVLMPSQASEIVMADKKKYGENSAAFISGLNLPKDVTAKIAAAFEETEAQKGSELYENIHDEFLNMCSAKMINGIIENDGQSKMLFDISYANVFKLSGKEPPAVACAMMPRDSTDPEPSLENTEFGFQKTDDGYIIGNSSQTAVKSLSVSKKADGIYFAFDADKDGFDALDLYIDMNGIRDAGCGVMLKDTEGFFVPENYWEYAVRISGGAVTVYRFYINDLNIVKSMPAANDGVIKIPSEVLRGNPYNWSYQAVASKDGQTVDFLSGAAEKEKIMNTSPLQLRMFKCE